MAHGIDTTIVEIDPVVYEFATKYFSLPQGHTAVIADAVSYASQLASTAQKFDYVVHDVFTGGAEPVDLFTFEFVQDLHSILKPGGVIAIVGFPIISFCNPLTSTELRWRPSPSISTHHNPDHQIRLSHLPDIPRIRTSISHHTRSRRP